MSTALLTFLAVPFLAFAAFALPSPSHGENVQAPEKHGDFATMLEEKRTAVEARKVLLDEREARGEGLREAVASTTIEATGTRAL